MGGGRRGGPAGYVIARACPERSEGKRSDRSNLTRFSPAEYDFESAVEVGTVGEIASVPSLRAGASQ